ncbi:recombinase family protein [Lachnospiraceae bacterium YH-ros2228]|jgi:DNA invertase Pin-like site-specific DNA recombinase|nr:recombinase family protein [Lachnospiraceae bacterium]MCI1657196.1 recombinase family protein [Lachnospiraceae bacterium]MCI2195587.1 recombinase family protein [Lachnospiraceae bacterium]
MKKITEIKKMKPVLPERKKVAAYCRVSMETERLHHSLSAQVSRYSELIQSNPQWEFAGIYADEGISGTKAEKRPEFMRLIADCDAGKIDIVLTKSISRFARNTVDLLKTVRHLKDIGVEVRFEKENIRSLSDDGELMLTLLASFAQEESRSISENEKWSVKKRMEQGIPTAKPPILGYKWVGNHLEIVPEEAAVVKRIFQNFLDGKSRLETERELEAEGIRSVNGNVMRDSQLKHILNNITYTGNTLLQKEFVEDPITKKRRKNKGQLPQYYIENTHEAIIDYDTWKYVQDEMERRRELGALANKSLNTCCFTGKIKCPYCGFSYMHNHRNKNGHPQEYWNCGSKKKKQEPDKKCPVGGTISQKALEKACCEVLGLSEFNEAVFLEKVDHIEVPEKYTLQFFLKDGTKITRPAPNTGHQDCWTAEYRAETSKKRREHPYAKGTTELSGRIKCTACGCNFRRCTQPASNPNKPKMHYWRCSAHGKGCITIGLREDVLKKQIAEVMGIPEYDADLFKNQIPLIYVKDKDLLEIHFKDGRVETTQYAPPEKTFTPRSEESREHMRQLMKERWTPEYKAQMSRKMKQIRSEKFWNSSGK